MRSLFRLSLLTVAVILVNGCSNCNNTYDDLDFSPYMHQYFGVFEEGNYFIYLNQDGTKRDSIYISDFSEEVSTNRSDCTHDSVRKGLINSEYLSNGNIRFYYGTSIDYAEIQLIDWNESGSLSIFFDTYLDTTVLQAHGNVEPEYFDSLLIWESPSQIDYEVWRFPDSVKGDLYFAKDKGLVQFTVPSTQDTFKLTNYFIQ